MYIVVFQTKGQYSPLDQDIMSVFGAGTAVDTSKTTAVFDFAAQVTNQSTASSHVTQYSSLIGQAGKYWKVGGIGCEFFRRCETPVSSSILTSIVSKDARKIKREEAAAMEDY